MTVQEQIKELQGKITERNSRLQEIFKQAGPDMDMAKVTAIDGDSKAKVEQITALNTELADYRQQLDEKTALVQMAKDATEGAKEGQQVDTKDGATKSFGEQLTDSGLFKSWNREIHIDCDVKTLMETGAGWAPESVRSGLVVPDAQRPIQLTDLIPSGTTNQAAYKYMEETTFTNNAAEAAEGAQYGEAALVLTERSATVEKVAVWLPITDEQLEDVQGAQAYVEGRLNFMLRQRADYQIAQGDGSTPNLQGIENLSGIQTQAKGADPVPDAIYKAMTLVRVTGRAMPNAVALHPNDWQGVRLLRTSDGIYIWGNPSEPGPEYIWGLRVVQSDALTENTGVVGDWANFSMMLVRRGIDVQVTNAHSDYFIKGKKAIRADFRAVLVWTRPAAFCTVTGI